MFGNDYVVQIGDAQTPDEMRKELHRICREEALIGSVFNTARFNGLSGEDCYVMLAYLALKSRNEILKQHLHLVSITPSPMMIRAEPQP